MKEVIIFTDGACRNNQAEQNVGGYGALLLYKGKEKEIFGGAINTTNNVMEMTAVIEALRQLKQKDLRVAVFSDSAYIVNAFQERWFDKWRLNGWRNAKKEPVENRALWEQLLELTESFSEVSFYKIKGHLKENSKEYGTWYDKFNEQFAIDRDTFRQYIQNNQRVDELANRGASQMEEPCSGTT